MILNRYDNETYLLPYWVGDTVIHEPLALICDENGSAHADLLFDPCEVLSVRSSTLETAFVEGKDYKVTGRTLIALPGGAMPTLDRAELFSGKPTFPAKDGTRFYRGFDSSDMLIRQVAVTYRHREKWTGYVPTCAKNLLPRVCEKLFKKESIHITFVGDSITAMGNISGTTDTAPFMPKYADMMVEALCRLTGSEITFDNFAIGGTQSEDFFNNQSVCDQACNSRPDLLVIAYGMNDGTWRPADQFASIINKIDQTVKEKNPECESIAVSTLIPNRDVCWDNGAPIYRLQDQYEQALLAMEDVGFAVARMTSIYQYIESKKDFYSLTGNGINHPNDFVIRAYAQTLVTMLLGTY